jgi:hypothetical protein
VTADIHVGAKVKILQPDYVAGQTGIIISPELLSDNQPSDRWIVRVDAEEILLSLHPNEFLVLE